MNIIENNENIENYIEDENEIVEVLITTEFLDYIKKIGLVEGVDYFIDN